MAFSGEQLVRVFHQKKTIDRKCLRKLKVQVEKYKINLIRLYCMSLFWKMHEYSKLMEDISTIADETALKLSKIPLMYQMKN